MHGVGHLGTTEFAHRIGNAGKANVIASVAALFLGELWKYEQIGWIRILRVYEK